MGRAIVIGAGGGGAGSDECTLIRANVPQGLTAVTADSDDEAVEGLLNTETTVADSHVLEGQSYLKFNPQTKLFECRSGGLKNNGAISGSLNCGQSKTIPAGYTTGGTVTANSLASQTPGNAHAGAILAGHSAWVNGSQVSGGIPSYGGQTVAPQTYAQTLSIAGHYNTGNVVINPFPLPPASYIKKGVNWYGVVGTANGWVAEPTDLYLYGNNPYRWAGAGGAVADSGQLTNNVSTSNTIYVYTQLQVNLSGFSRINIFFYALTGNTNGGTAAITRGANSGSKGTNIKAITSQTWPIYTNNTTSIDISSYNITDTIGIFISAKYHIYRIWLS